jgi:hypothetical protein
MRREGVSMMVLLGVMAIISCASVAGAEVDGRAAEKALPAAVDATIKRFNQAEEKLRDAPRVERTGPERDPQMMRATYRRAGGAYSVVTPAGDDGIVTVRVRSVELEKRATNVNDDVERDFAKAPWRETPRGYLLDFRFRWNGTEWEPLGEPVSRPTLGVVGKP